MIHSMTGFGRGVNENDEIKVSIEIKAVNHRYLDFVVRMPKKYSSLEENIKRLVKKRVDRGRVEVYVNVEENNTTDYKVVPNYGVIDEYMKAFNDIKDRYELTDKVGLPLIARYQDILNVELKEIDEEEIMRVFEGSVNNALDSLVKMRAAEGETLAKDVVTRCEFILGVLERIEVLTPEILVAHKNKMIERINELIGDNVEIDESRILMEVAVFADKTNITEEIVRLRSHIEQLNLILKEDGSKGRKLDFLLQEMNREVNTIGSKSPDVDISNFVVELKSELEKVREQIQNIE